MQQFPLKWDDLSPQQKKTQREEWHSASTSGATTRSEIFRSAVVSIARALDWGDKDQLDPSRDQVLMGIIQAALLSELPNDRSCLFDPVYWHALGYLRHRIEVGFTSLRRSPQFFWKLLCPPKHSILNFVGWRRYSAERGMGPLRLQL
jgi:hypothetical protein